jgi:polyhydroxyalkanoate synthase
MKDDTPRGAPMLAPAALPAPAPGSAPAPQQAGMAGLLDPAVHAYWARLNGAVSPESIRLAWMDWLSHMAISPGKCYDLAALGLAQALALADYQAERLRVGPGAARACVVPPAQDRRFAAPAWQEWPFNLIHQGFLLNERWWDAATHGVWGVEPHHEQVVAFMTRQWLDLFSPGNQLLTNPLVLARTADERGANLARGTAGLLGELRRAITATAEAPGETGAEASYVVGRDLARTPGTVVLRNRLIELIQYAPTTARVHPQPILLVPAWIMKYYILDLSAHNSLVAYLVAQGHTVFCISWKNPDADERDLGMDDYLSLGLRAALDQVRRIVPEQRVHLAGYCLGGTLATIAAAAMARDGDERLASLTLFAAQTDFTEPGELALFIDEGQVSLLEAQMADTGYLTAQQMSGAFVMLHSADLLWSRMVNQYLLGESAPQSDLMAWNADATRMPARMHSQYLRRLFLNDDLSEGRYPVDGRPVALNDLEVPLFCVGTLGDHIAPWRSVYKLHYQCRAELTFVLTSGGHNAGIVSEPGHRGRNYQIGTRAAGAGYVAPDAWAAEAPRREGSWWPAWQAWLAQRSDAPVAPPPIGVPGEASFGAAPGTYVLAH